MQTSARTLALRTILAGSIAALLGGTSGHAATYYWDTTTTGTWATGANWSDNATTGGTTGVVPLATDVVVFNQSSLNGNETVQLDAATSIAGITFNNTGTTDLLSTGGTARALTLGTGGITIGASAGAVTLGDGVTATNDVLISLGAGAQTWTNNSGNAFTINNTAATFTRAAGSTLTFNQAGAGVFSMSTTVLPNANGIVGPWAFFGTGTSMKYAVNNAGTIAGLTGTAAADAEAFISATDNYDFSTTGTTTLTANRTANTVHYTGTGNTIDLGAAGTNTLTLNGILATGASGTLLLQRTGGTGTVVVGASNELVIAGPQAVTISAPISGASGAVVYSGTGTLMLSNTANSHGGGVKVNSGTVIANTNNGTNVTGLGAGAVTIAAGATLNLLSLNTAGAASAINNTFTGTGLLKVTFHTGSASGSSMSGINGFAGTLQLANDQANGDKLSGAINAPGATLQIDSGSTLYTDTAQTFGAIKITGTGNNENRGAIRLQSTLTGLITLTGSATINGAGGTIAGTVSSGAVGTQILTLGSTGATTGIFNSAIGGGTGTIEVTQAGGTHTFLGNNTYTGVTNINGGTLVAGHVNALTTSSGVNISTATGGGTLRLATDTSVGAYVIGGSSSNAGTITADRATAGAGITHVLGAAALGNNTYNFTAGTNVTSGVAGVSFASLNIAGGFAGTTVLNPTTADLSIVGPVNIGSSNFAKTLELGGSSAGSSISGLISNGLNTLTLTKSGTGTWTLTNSNTFTGLTSVNAGTLVLTGTDALAGAVTVAAGTLKLNYGTNDTSKLADAQLLTLSGGTLELAGGTHTEIVGSTTVSTQPSTVTRSSGAAVLQMNAITRTSASINFASGSIATTDNTNTNGILGTWATVGGVDWATNSTNGADGLITAYSAYTDVTRLSSGTKAIADGSTSNVRILEGTGAAGSLTLGAATTTISTLNQSASGGSSAATIDPAGQTLALNGILGGTGAGALTIGTGTNNGTVKSATTDLLVNNIAGSDVTIRSIIADGTGTSTLTKLGAGALILSGNSTFAGGVAITEGQIRIANSGALGTGTKAITITAGPASGAFPRLELDGSAGNITLASGITLNVSGNNANFGVLRNLSGDNTVNGVINLTLGNGGTLIASNGGTLTLAGNITANTTGRTLTLDGTSTGNNTVSGIISNGSTAALPVTKQGTGTWRLTNANTFSGGVTLSAGTLILGNKAAAGTTAGTLNMANGTTLQASADLSGVNAVANPWRVGTTTTISGTNNLTLSGLYSSAGGDIGIANNLSGGAALVISNTLAIANNGTGRIFTLSGNGNTTISGAITNGSNATTSAVTISNSGTTILSGLNTYGGTTAISGGVTRINNTGATNTPGLVNVTGGALGGTGRIGGAVTVSSVGGINLADGAIGTLTLASTLTISGSTGANNLTFDLGNATNTTDQITVGSGGTSVTNNGVINFNQLGQSAGGRVNAGTYTLIQAAAAPTLAKYALATTAAFGSTYTLAVSGNNLQVTTVQVAAGPAAAFWGGAPAGTWTTAGNWFTTINSNTGTGAVPGYQTNVTFVTTTPVVTLGSTTLNADFDINSLTFNTTSTGMTIAGATNMLTIEATNANGNTAGNGITSANASGTNTISAKVGLASSQTWTVGTGGTLTVSGVISDFGARNTLTKAGGGILNLTGANTFTGPLVIKEGTLQANNPTAITTSSSLTLGDATGVSTTAATLDVTSTSNVYTYTKPINVVGTNQVNTIKDSNFTQNYSGPITLTNAELTLNQATTAGQTYSGGITGSGAKQNLIISNSGSGGSLTISTNAVNIAGTITNSGSTAASTTISATIGTNVTGVTQSGTSTLTLSGANYYAGVTTVNAGTLNVNNASALGTTAGGTVVNGVTAGSGTGDVLALQLAGVTIADEALTLDSASGRRASLYTNTVGTQTWNGNITSSGAGTNAFWADAASAVLVIGSDAADTVTQNAGLLFLRGGSGSGIVNSTIGGSGPVTKGDSGTWTIASTNNSYAGNTSIFQGTLVIGSIAASGANSSIGTGSTITFGQNQGGANGTGTLQFTGAAGGTSDRAIFIGNGASGGAAVIENTVVGQTLTLSGNIATATPASASTLAVQGAGNGVLSGNVTGAPALALVKFGAGTWTLSGTNTYTGGTSVTTGALVFLNTGAKPSSGTHAFGAGTTLGLGVATSGSFFTDTDVTNAFAGNMTGNLSNVTVTSTTDVGIDTSAGDFTYSTSVTGSPTKGLTKLGANTLILSGANTYTGPTTVTGGKLEISGSISGSTQVNVSGGTLLLSGAGGTNNKLNSTTPATVALNGGALDLSGITTTSLDQTVGTLSLSGTSNIDFGTLLAGNTFRFADSHSQIWTGATLSIYDWTPNNDHLFFGADASGLTPTQLGQITFYGSSDNSMPLGTATSIGGGELAAVPEPSSLALVVGVLGLVGYRERRRLFGRNCRQA